MYNLVIVIVHSVCLKIPWVFVRLSFFEETEDYIFYRASGFSYFCIIFKCNFYLHSGHKVLVSV